jgi:trehalose-6-phosphate synthase
MNVTAFEFTACQEQKMAPIVLSEFAGLTISEILCNRP